MSINDTHESLLQGLRTNSSRIVASIAYKEAEDLSEEEKFAIAFLAGVKIRGELEGNRFVIKTELCGFTKVNGKFIVHTRQGT